MAALKPIVTTAMEELKKYSFVMVANNSEEFVHLLDKAILLKTDRLYIEGLRNEAMKNTWDSRVNMIVWWIKQPNFQKALIEYMKKSSNANHPMRDVYFEFASSTVDRGNVAAELIMNHTTIKGKRYLDVGCAYGGFPIAFALRGANEAIGVDINDDYIGLAKTLLKDYDCPVQPKFFVRDILKCEEQDFGRFDIITCNDVIEHVDSPELLVKTLSILSNSEGIIYMEIPNANNYRMVMRDGHYGLFGITLLDRPSALLYYEHFFKEIPYSVGEYLDFNGYLKLFRSHGMEPILLNEIPKSEEELHQIANFIASLEDTYKTNLKNLPESLKEHLQEALMKYINNFSISYNQFLNSQNEARAANARHLYCYYGIDFWRFLLKKG
jgi:2-polyprenyl-3-methyl-5-hydroxy-6-metoxy-1,4-benzoquinol methylase